MELIITYILAMIIVLMIDYDIKFINRESKIILTFMGIAFIFALGKKLGDYTSVGIILSFVIVRFFDLKRDDHIGN